MRKITKNEKRNIKAGFPIIGSILLVISIVANVVLDIVDKYKKF